MLVVSAAKDWFLLIAQRWKVTLPCFAAGAVLFLAVAAWWPKAYTGAALVGLNPAVNWQPDIAIERATEADALREASTSSAWASIVNRLHLSPETVADGRLSDAANSLASKVSIQQTDDAKHGGPVLRVSYSSSSRELAQDVTAAVAENLSYPSAFAPMPLLASLNPDSPPLPVAAAISNPTLEVDLQSGPKTTLSLAAQPRKELRSAPLRRSSPPPSQTRSAGLTHQMQTLTDEGTKLNIAINENAATLSGLQQRLAEMDRKPAPEPPIVKSVPAQPEPKAVAPKANPQMQSLRQDLAHNQQVLDDLQKRYTDDYPDVVAAKDKVRDLQLDISRLEAIDAQSAQLRSAPVRPVPAEPPPAPPRATIRDESARNRIAQQLNEAGSVDKRLRQALDHNHAQVARVQGEMASSENTDTASIPPSKDANVEGTAQVATPPTTALTSLASPGTALRSSAEPSVEDPGRATPNSPWTPAAGALLSIAEGPMVAVHPLFFAAPLSWLLSIFFGALAALAAALLAERRDPSIRSERMLRHLLPDASFLGGIPRIRHEVIPE